MKEEEEMGDMKEEEDEEMEDMKDEDDEEMEDMKEEEERMNEEMKKYGKVKKVQKQNKKENPTTTESLS